MSDDSPAMSWGARVSDNFFTSARRLRADLTTAASRVGHADSCSMGQSVHWKWFATHSE